MPVLGCRCPAWFPWPGRRRGVTRKIGVNGMDSKDTSPRNRGELVSSTTTRRSPAIAVDTRRAASSFVRIHSLTGIPEPPTIPRSSLIESRLTISASIAPASSCAIVLFPEKERPHRRTSAARSSFIESRLMIRFCQRTLPVPGRPREVRLAAMCTSDGATFRRLGPGPGRQCRA